MARLVLLVLLHLPTLSLAQADTTLLHLHEYYALVGKHHPVAKQALLLTVQGELAVSEARGSFDPKLVSNYETKNYQGTDYFDIWDSYVSVPTLLNIDLKAGYERNSGSFLNSERNLPSNGLHYLGVSVPLGQGLFTSPRNIVLKKSKAVKQRLEVESRKVVNDLLLDANYAYWSWFEAFQKKEIASSNLDLILERFTGIREGVLNGENAAIDSVEALIQVQEWANNLEKAHVDFQNSLLLMQNFLWSDSISIDELSPQTEPRSIILDLNAYLDFARTTHPDWRLLQMESTIIDLDMKLKSDQLKPTIRLNYNVLLNGQEKINGSAFLHNNYKGGLQFEFPLLIREARAKLNRAKLNIQENELKQTQALREITNQIRQSYNWMITLSDMIRQQEQMLTNYEFMLQGERIRFDNGESSIFLINTRENKKLEAEIKLAELRSEYGKSLGVLEWSSGRLADKINSFN